MLHIVARMVLAMVGIFLAAATDSSAETEQLCKELGGNCVCSEPFNTPSYSYRAPNYYFNDSDQPCSLEASGSAVARNSSDLLMTNDRAIVGRLTSAPIYVVRGPEGHVNLWNVGHFLNDATRFIKRMAYRWYVYYSQNFEFAYEGSCTNTKIVQMEIVNIVPTPHMAMYNFSSWPPSFTDCCFDGPTASDMGPDTYAEYKGKWWRYEVVITNRAGGAAPNGLRVQMYMRNVTDKLSERLVIDTMGTAGHGPYGPYRPYDNYTIDAPLMLMRPSLFRETRTAGKVCNGYNALSYYMLAGWDTDVGQRIGPALEIEKDATPPAAPTKPSSLLK
jgi:hypothetical protein